jgi:cytochrome c-type biogenesis protein CcmH/NrfG
LPTSATNRRQLLVHCFPAFVFLVACLQYLGTVGFDYAWDDKLVITANAYTTKGIAGLPEIFTKRVSVPFKSEYRPVPQALYAIEYQLFRGSPHAGHVFNMLWYGLTCAMVYWFVHFVFPWLDSLFAFRAAVLFVVHPLHVEVVANVKGRDEILALFFGLSSIMLLVKAIERFRWGFFIVGGICFLTACLSKANAITLLPMAVAIAWYRSKTPGLNRTLVGMTAAIAACSVGLIILIRHLQNTVSNEMPLQLNSTVLNNIFLWTTHPNTVIPTALMIITRYIRLLVYPHPLIQLYGYNQISLSHWTDFGPWLVLAALIGVGALVFKIWPSRSPLAFGLVFFAVTYSPYSNLFFYAPDTMADRYMFVPSVGAAIVAVFCLFRVAALAPQAPGMSGARARAAVTVFGLILAGFFATSVAASQDWRNDSTLIHNRIRYMQNNAAAQAIYGYTLNKESYNLLAPQLKEERQAAAMLAFTEAIRIYPDFQAAWIAIGKLFADHGIYYKAELSFLKAQRLEPLGPESYFCLGTLYLTQQDLGLAIPYLEKAVLLDSKNEDAYVMLGKAYLQANNVGNLGGMITAARKWFPENLDLKALAATYYFRMGDYRRALVLARDVAAKDARNILAMTILSSPMVQGVDKK